MKPHPVLILIGLFVSVLVLVGGCLSKQEEEHDDNFLTFLTKEIARQGGKTNGVITEPGLQGKWAIRRDQFGALIEVEGVSFAEISNALARAYGPPRYYTRADRWSGPTFVYATTNIGIALFICETGPGTQVVLTRLLKPEKP